ncbi:MAG: hypothetical protein L6R36_006362 [Xanthoria steineri]|nr:MAG: hypothetical protein L6R36_006362 [Xanthoria steineri]
MSRIKCNEEPQTVGPSTLYTVLPIDPIQSLYEQEHVTTGIDLDTSSPQATDAGFSRLQELIQSLPLELFDQIRETVYELAFCPGFAFPHQQTSQGTCEWNGTVYNTTRPQLLCISKAVRERYQTKIFSENIFVVGPGQTHRTLRFLGVGERRHPLPIRSAHASLSYRDLGEDWAEQLPMCDVGGAPPSEEDWSTIQYLKQQNSWPDRWADQSYPATLARLKGLWAAKYWRLMQLPLEELTVDFTECYGGYNEWLGSYVAKFIRLRSPPAPSILRVIAPDHVERRYIHDILSRPSR